MAKREERRIDGKTAGTCFVFSCGTFAFCLPLYHCCEATHTATMAAPKSPSLGMKDLYLILYNGACCIGWAYVLFVGIPSFFSAVASSDASLIDALKAAGSSVYFATPATAGFGDEVTPSLATVLFYVQSAALLEIVHAALGLVRSPVFVTAMQVGSRIVALHMITSSPKAQSEFDLYLILSAYILLHLSMLILIHHII